MQMSEKGELREAVITLFKNQPDAIFTLKDVFNLLGLSYVNILAREILLELGSENVVFWMAEKNSDGQLQFRLQRDNDPRFYDMGL
jgi:hypothetical protein